MEKKDITYPMDDTDRLLSIQEVADRLRTSRSFVSDLLHFGLLRALKFGSHNRVRKSTFNNFLAKYDGQDLIEVIKEQRRLQADVRN